MRLKLNTTGQSNYSHPHPLPFRELQSPCPKMNIRYDGNYHTIHMPISHEF